jgi:hypothetical protein
MGEWTGWWKMKEGIFRVPLGSEVKARRDGRVFTFPF